MKLKLIGISIPKILGNAVFRVRLFSYMARHDDATWPPPVKRSNAAMDEKKRAMDPAFPGILGTYNINE